ncbi:MAG TPA: hypothetical protein VH307_11670 [Streptosporangiaceae bacterium]|jgi:hypothetical protein|nr:hypothetical protein [Streptosporangiaceae bacterium]
MAVLYGRIQAPPADDFPELPTEHELQPAERRELELKRLRHLLRQLADQPGMQGSGLPTEVPADNGDEPALSHALMDLNLAILEALAVAPPDVQLAYELGRSLRDTINPPLEFAKGGTSLAPALARQLARARVAKLQEWLGTLSTQFPQHTAAIVAVSLGRWSEFAAVTVNTPTSRVRQGDGAQVATTMSEYLLPQGDLWLQLLTGGRSASGLLSPEGYVAAAELALHRSAAIVRQVLRRYVVELLILAAALGAVLYLAVSYLGGAAKVWTSIAAIGGSLGITARTITSATSRLATEAEQPVFAMAEEDAMAWAITTLPPVKLTARGTKQLRQAGVAPPSSLGRI